MTAEVTVHVDGHKLALSNLDKELYPEVGLTKAGVIDYYRRVASVLLPHLVNRTLTMFRCPDGVGKPGFFDKNAARHAPSWLRTCAISASPGGGEDPPGYALINDLAGLVWVANLAGVELHVPQWTIGPRGGRRLPDLLVFDLDPGAPATIVQCCAVALRLRERLAADGLTSYAKTSGSKGMQLYAPVQVSAPERTSAYAHTIANELAVQCPDAVISRMTRSLRPGKVFIDWSQNNPAKTTVAPYSLRARPCATVSTPVTWEEVAACRVPDELSFTYQDVLTRIADSGDLMEPLLLQGPRLPR
ncbi:MAG: ATP-dependent DNA ligase [Acidimicrobiales bacterium]|nr:MAG: ATP-dependent DNA ligase [Acidimicrobiales bacterium]